MIFTKKQAKRLKTPMTIDLRRIILESEGYVYCPKKKYDWIISYFFIFGVLAFIFFLMVCYTSFNKTNAQGKDYIDYFPEYTTRIGCYNDITKETRKSDTCFEKGDHNIFLPAKAQIKVWLKYYTPYQITNRLALVNFESRFDENAGNEWAKGYVQTLRSHNVAIDIDSQLKWMSNREKNYSGKTFNGKGGVKKGCGIYWEQDNIRDGFEAGEYAVLSCLYRFHYEANTGSWYGIRGVTTTKFYKNYLFGVAK